MKPTELKETGYYWAKRGSSWYPVRVTIVAGNRSTVLGIGWQTESEVAYFDTYNGPIVAPKGES